VVTGRAPLDGGHRRCIAVRFRTSKPGVATITLPRGGRVLVAARLALAGGPQRFCLRPPRRSRRTEVRVDATSPTELTSLRTPGG
jgi:hypothetical protein